MAVRRARAMWYPARPATANDEVRIGQRVRAVWKPESEWGYAMENISYFKPIDEADDKRDEAGQ